MRIEGRILPVHSSEAGVYKEKQTRRAPAQDSNLVSGKAGASFQGPVSCFSLVLQRVVGDWSLNSTDVKYLMPDSSEVYSSSIHAA